MLNVDVLMLEMLNAHVARRMWSILDDVESSNNFMSLFSFVTFFLLPLKNYLFPSSLPLSIISPRCLSMLLFSLLRRQICSKYGAALEKLPNLLANIEMNKNSGKKDVKDALSLKTHHTG